jgi:hypothetical protein
MKKIEVYLPPIIWLVTKHRLLEKEKRRLGRGCDMTAVYHDKQTPSQPQDCVEFNTRLLLPVGKRGEFEWGLCAFVVRNR